jgi:hypothetical protein
MPERVRLDSVLGLRSSLAAWVEGHPDQVDYRL